jgi:hypothetical protein
MPKCNPAPAPRPGVPADLSLEAIRIRRRLSHPGQHGIKHMESAPAAVSRSPLAAVAAVPLRYSGDLRHSQYGTWARFEL